MVTRLALFVAALSAGALNVLLLLAAGHDYLKPEQVRPAAVVLGVAAVAVPVLFVLLVGGLVRKRAKLSTRLLLGFALLHGPLMVVLFQGLDLGLADASASFAILEGRSRPPPPPPPPPVARVSADAGPPPPARPVPLVRGKMRPPEPDGGVMYQWEEGGSTSFARRIEDVPQAHRDEAGVVPLEAERPRREVTPRRTPQVEEGAGDDAARAVERLNRYRALVELPPVRLDLELSADTQRHADYLAANHDHPSLDGLGAHEEKPGLPGYSPEGARAGKAAVITFDRRAAADPIDKWMGTFFHRIPLLTPALARTGFGYAETDNPRRAHVWLLHVADRSGPRTGEAIVYPGAGHADVPLSFSGDETPNPLPPHDEDGLAGYPITVTFPKTDRVRGVSASLEDVLGTAVPYYLSTPDSPVVEGYQMNTICLIPESPLDSKSRYTVHIAAIVGGQKWSKRWSFTTR